LAIARPFTISFPDGRTAAVVQVDREDQLTGSLRALGLDGAGPTIVLVGGAGGLAEADHLRGFFTDALIPIASEVVDFCGRRLEEGMVELLRAIGTEQVKEVRRSTGKVVPTVQFCVHCGARVSVGNRFCIRCGARVEG
jgi:hypothetical protein